MDDILDSSQIPKRVIKKDYVKVSIILMSSLYAFSIALYILFSLNFTINLHLGYILFFIAVVSKFKNRKFYINILAIALFMGSLNIVSWLPFEFITFPFISIQVESIQITIGLQIISCILLAIHLAFFHAEIELLKPSENEGLKESVVENFIVKFETKKEKELLEILSSKSFSSEAKQAAKSVLESRDELS